MSFEPAAAGFKSSDLGRSYINLLQPLVRTSLIGNFENAKLCVDVGVMFGIVLVQIMGARSVSTMPSSWQAVESL